LETDDFAWKEFAEIFNVILLKTKSFIKKYVTYISLDKIYGKRLKIKSIDTVSNRTHPDAYAYMLHFCIYYTLKIDKNG